MFLNATGGLTADATQISLAISGVTTDFLFEVTYGANDAVFTALNDAVAGTSTIFLGSDRDDAFTAGAGDDLLTGGGGSDTLTGGAGADIFVFSLASNEGNDALLDFSVAEGDILFFADVLDVDAPGGIDIEDVVQSFVNDGGGESWTRFKEIFRQDTRKQSFSS